jgi:hypothetical protein
MGQNEVHGSHKWSRDNECKGCQCAIGSPESKLPCAKPYKPGRRKGTKDRREL